jgi:hypothetical protein
MRDDGAGLGWQAMTVKRIRVESLIAEHDTVGVYCGGIDECTKVFFF